MTTIAPCWLCGQPAPVVAVVDRLVCRPCLEHVAPALAYRSGYVTPRLTEYGRILDLTATENRA